jgi:hypothetical protein
MGESLVSKGRSEAFWEFLDGKRPAPPAAAMLGWELAHAEEPVIHTSSYKQVY